jgi:Ca2+-binding EF-hand superfamily protein
MITSQDLMLHINEYKQGGDNNIRKSDLWVICRSFGDVPSEVELQEISQGVGESISREAFLEIMTAR